MSYRDHLTELWRAIDQGHVELMDRFFTDDYQRHSDEGTLSRDEFAEALAALQHAVPDMETTLHDVLVDGDRAACRWSACGIHKGVYMGVPATGKPITASGITVSRFAPDGRIAEDWSSWNRVSVLHALGIIPISR